MEEGDSILDALYEEGDDLEDVDMVDVEEGEFIGDDDGDNVNTEPKNDTLEKPQSEDSNRKPKQKKKKKKKKNRRKNGGGGGGGPGPSMDINRFVLDTCRRLKERKSYMVYTAVGCLGVSALSELVKEVDVIQSCGGQMTADGKRPRTGGGVLWSIIKAREPNAYREIMKRAKEFEKQFKQQNIRQVQPRDKEALSGRNDNADVTLEPPTLDGSLKTQQVQDDAEEKRHSVKDRIRVPVSYEDILDGPRDETGCS